ncbi:MAG TPA: CdaR family protein [Polyangiaceae bacterium]|jgi:YbbR domain-containing protein
MRRVFRNALRFLIGAITENFGLKVLSLAFAIGLFVYLHGQQEEQQRTIPVGIIMRMPAESARRELMTPIPASIHITVRGSSRSMDRLVQAGVTPVEIDLRKGTQESITFEESTFSLPPGIQITIIDPPSIDLEWQDVVQRMIPIQASISGQPAAGFVVRGEPEVEPKQITARGPASLVEVIQFARLAPFDVSGLTENIYRRRIAIDAPPNRVKYIGPQSATVSVIIGRRLSEAKFANRPVEAVGVPVAVVIPRTVDVTVIGPPEVVRALRPEQVVPRADLTKVGGFNFKEQKRGSTTVPVMVDLANAEAEVQPPTVNVRW